MSLSRSLLLLFLPLTIVMAAEPSRPNILFIYTDDQSYRTVSCYEGAYPGVSTPNIDRLAKKGVRFTSAYIGTWCMPSRATMLTGLQQYGVQTMRMIPTQYPASEYDPEHCPFWPAELRKAGYQTAQIGKWHTGTDAGFGRDWNYQAVWNRPKHADNAPNYYHDQLISFNGAEPVLVEGYSTDNYTQWAANYIKGENRAADKPWYLWLCYDGVHSPYTPATRHAEDYKDAPVETPSDIYPPRPGKPEHMQKIAAWKEGSEGKPVLNIQKDAVQIGDDKVGDLGRPLEEWVRQYNQAVKSLDDGVGKLMAALEASGQLENTLVIFTSDQGLAWGEHGFRHKIAPYDANIRAPLIVSMPGLVAEDQICNRPVSGPDLVQTMVDITGVKLPWKTHGHDFMSLLKDPSGPWPHDAFMAMTGSQYGADTDSLSKEKIFHRGVPWYVLLRRDQYKYIRSLIADEIEELYDLERDPEELTNLAIDPKYRERLKTMRAAAIKELERTNAGFVKNLPPVKWILN